ncbi:MAG: hypothetical protein K9N52_00255 [Verrucomicrobia bacterium]|nr:hypothetical protein [Verrucomicrobiota bacterium]
MKSIESNIVERPLELLSRSLERGRLGQAYLFSGENRDILEHAAKKLIKALNCNTPPKQEATDSFLDSCGFCDNCRRIDSGNHSEVFWARPESKSRILTIDQVRELIRCVQMKPTEARVQVGVIVDADRMNRQAANAFLKTLEEPPGHAVLILLSTAPERLLETILSRCLRITFAGEDFAFFEECDSSWLRSLAEEMVHSRERLLTRYRLLSVFLNRLSETRSEIESEQGEKSALSKYPDAEEKQKQRWRDELIAAVESDYRRSRADMLTALQYLFRDVWMSQLGMLDSVGVYDGFSDCINALARRVTEEDVLHNIEVIAKAQRLLAATNVQEALALEVSFLNLRF